jgi:nucleoside-diphosphate-sugar epimerase
MPKTVSGRQQKPAQLPMDSKFIVSPEELVLITGSNGFIGARVVEILLEYGFRNVRCFVRSSSRLRRLESIRDRFQHTNIEMIKGDLLSREDCRKAADGVAIVLHLAAGIDKAFAGAYMNSALAARNLIEAFLEHGKAKRFVNVSSFAVYSNRRLKRGAVLDETCPLENAPQERYDAYGFGKLKQEELVREYGNKYDLPFVILRPGAVFGPGKKELSGRVGINTFGVFMHMGGSKILPLTFVDNCAEAIVLAGIKPDVDGEVFNIVDDETMTSRSFLKAYKKVKPMFSVPVPYFLACAMCVLWERYSKWSKGQIPAVFNLRRCAAEWKGNRFSNRKLREHLGWTPRVKMEDAMAAFLAQFESNSQRAEF